MSPNTTTNNKDIIINDNNSLPNEKLEKNSFQEEDVMIYDNNIQYEELEELQEDILKLLDTWRLESLILPSAEDLIQYCHNDFIYSIEQRLRIYQYDEGRDEAYNSTTLIQAIDGVGAMTHADERGREGRDASSHSIGEVLGEIGALADINKLLDQHYYELVSENSRAEQAYHDLGERLEASSDVIESKQKENIDLSEELNSLTSDYDSVIAERDALLLSQGQDGSAESSVPVFPYVDWSRANKSKAFYKDANWKDIPFDDLSELEIENIDWSKVNYKEAEQAESFDIDFIDAAGWGEINSAGKKQKKIYKDLNWQGVDYQSLSDGTKEGIEWSRVDYKEAIRSEAFNLDSVDIAELKANPKAFKKFLKATALKKASADSLLAEASSETLEGIGLKSYAGKISDKITKSFSTDSGEYKLVMKPRSFDRASAIAKGMGGTLAVFETEQESDDFADGLTGVINERSVARKILNQAALTAGRYSHGNFTWLGGSVIADLTQGDDESEISVALASIIDDLGEDYVGYSQWFIIETGEIRSIASPHADPLSTNFDIVSQFDSGILNSPADIFQHK